MKYPNLVNSQHDYTDFVNDEVLKYTETVIRFRYTKYHKITSTTSTTTV